MTVYVDDMFLKPLGRYGRLKMSHMIATDVQELHDMANKIGVQHRWFQGDHYDIAITKRELAIKFGAVPITLKQAAAMMHFQRRGLPMGGPDDAVQRRMAHSTDATS